MNVPTTAHDLPTIAGYVGDDLVTTAHIAVAYGVSRETVRRWVRDGRLTPVGKLAGVRGAYLFPATAVAELLPITSPVRGQEPHSVTD